MSKSRPGSLNPFFGKKHTEETKRIIREKRALQKSSGMKGKRHSEESKRKMSEKRRRGGELTKRQKKELEAGRKTAEQCEICRTPGKEFKKGLCFDHDHNSGKFRGWLCSNCNSALGLTKESPMVLQGLIDYILRNK